MGSSKELIEVTCWFFDWIAGLSQVTLAESMGKDKISAQINPLWCRLFKILLEKVMKPQAENFCMLTFDHFLSFLSKKNKTLYFFMELCF